MLTMLGTPWGEPSSLRSVPEAASLLELEPSLSRIVGHRVAAAIGHQRRLPVLSLELGEWSPPAREERTGAVLTFAVLDGWLLGLDDTRVLLGPGDRLEPWDAGVHWVACTRVRLALLGEAFNEALSEWPAAALKLRMGRRPLHAPRASEALGERLLELLWCLARHWGTLGPDGIQVPATVGRSSLARLLAAPERQVELALTSLRDQGVVGHAGGWTLRAGSGERRDALRARMAEQFALARLGAADHAALSAQFDAEVRRRDERRGGG